MTLTESLRKHLTTASIVFFVVGFGAGISIQTLTTTQHTPITSNCVGTHQFINPELDCAETIEIYERIDSVESAINALVTKKKDAREVERVSVFFRDLTTRKWFGVNENKEFAPGSLLKLPLAIAYEKLFEFNPSMQDQKFVYTPDGESLNQMQHFTPERKLEAGKTYSVKELIEIMIAYSDNDALPILAQSIDPTFYNKVYLDLGIHFPTSGGIEQDFISVKTYGSILRMLYNASYLNPARSEEILDVMARSSFEEGIPSGVPRNTVVAHKFGERTLLDEKNGEVVMHELHDCGIVYAKKNPYILCIMTSGHDMKNLTSIISEISRTTYEEMQ